MMQDRGLTVGNVARRAGLRPSAIRYYESAGLLPAAVRVNGWRRYDATVLTRLAVIDVAQRAGFTLAEIRTLFQGFSPRTSPSSRWHRLARQKLPEVEALIARAGIMKRLLEEGLNCGCLRLKDCALLVPTIGPRQGNRPPPPATLHARALLPRAAASRRSPKA
jgi:MerR family transcriptional regulator, redox-sensitive transcriptional activator SoxR